MGIFKQLWELLSRALRQNRPDEPIEAFEICEPMTDEELRAKLNEILCEICGNWTWCKKDKLFDDHYPDCPRHPANVEYDQELVEQEKTSAVLKGYFDGHEYGFGPGGNKSPVMSQGDEEEIAARKRINSERHEGCPICSGWALDYSGDLNTYHHPVCPNHPTNRRSACSTGTPD